MPETRTPQEEKVDDALVVAAEREGYGSVEELRIVNPELAHAVVEQTLALFPSIEAELVDGQE